MSEIVQALASLLSADSQSRAHLGAAQMAANASLGNSANALNADVYRANVQGGIANRGIDADMQRNIGEQALRAMLGRGQLQMQGQQNNLAAQQLGLERQRFGTERDLKLGELGQGPYAPQIPGAPKGPDGEDMPDTPEAMIKRMFMANPNNPKFAAMMGDLMQQGQRQSQWKAEFDMKKGATSDPNTLFAALAPSIAGMEGVNVSNIGTVLAALREHLGTGAAMPTIPGARPAAPDLATAAKTITAPGTSELMKLLGLDEASTPWQTGEAIGERASTLTPNDLASLQTIVAAKYKADPKMFDQQAALHPGVLLLKKLLASPSSSLHGSDLQNEFETQRREYYKGKNDPKEFTLFGIPKFW